MNPERSKQGASLCRDSDPGGFELYGRTWGLCLSLAEAYGWRPLGTLPPEEVEMERAGLGTEWDGRYLEAYGQRMSEADADAFSVALERALPDVPHHDALSHKIIVPPSEAEPYLWGRDARPGASINALEEFSGSNRPTFEELITFLRGSGDVWVCP
jgi:hypothetical protein